MIPRGLRRGVVRALLAVPLLGCPERPAGPAAPPSPSAAAAGSPSGPAGHDSRTFLDASALARGGRWEESLDHYEAAIREEPENLRYGNEYRKACVQAGEHQRAIEFLERQVAASPEVTALRLNLALAYVDKMPTPGLGIVGQGLLSNRSIRELNAVLEREPTSWVAMYGRAMNHLHWPRMLRHAPMAIEDFRACLDLQAGVPRQGLKPHHLLPWLGLGDAQVKNGSPGEARAAYAEAARLFPGDPRPARRQALDDAALAAFVEEERGLARPIDTDLAFVWSP